MCAAAVFTSPTTLTYARVDGGTRDPLSRDYKVLLDPETSELMKELGLGGPGLDFTILRQGIMRNGQFHKYSSTKLELMAGRIVDLAFGKLPTTSQTAQATNAAKTIARDLLRDDVKTLREEVTSLSQRVDQTDTLKREIGTLEKERDELETALADLQQNIDDLKSENENQAQKLSDKDRAIGTLKQSLEEKTLSLEEIDTALSNHKEEIRQLAASLERNMGLRQEAEEALKDAEQDYNSRLQDLEKQQFEALGERDEKIEQLQDEYNETRASLTEKIAVLADQRTQAETDVQGLREHTEKLEETLLAKQQLLADKAFATEILDLDYSTRVKNLTEQQHAALAERDEKIEQLQVERKELRTSIEDLERAIAEKTERLRNLGNLQEERDHYIAQLCTSETARIELEQKLAIAAAKVDGLQRLYRGAIRTRETLECEIAQLKLDKSREAESEAKEKEAMQQLLDIRKGIITDAGQDLQTLHSRVVALTKALGERKQFLKEHTEQIESLHTHLNMLEGQIATQQAELAEARKPKTVSIAGLLKDLENTSTMWEKRLSNSQDMIETLLTLLDQSAGESTELKKELAALATALQETKASARAREEALRNQLGQIQTATKTQSSLKLAKAQEARRALQTQLNEAMTASSEKDSQIQELTKQVVEVKAQLAATGQEKAEKETYIGELEAEIMGHQVGEYPQDEVDSLNLTIDDLASEIERLEARIVLLAAERDEARATMSRMNDFSDTQDERLRRGLERLHELFPERVGINLEAAKLRTLFFNRIVLGDITALTEAEDVLSQEDFEKLTQFIQKKKTERASNIRANQNSPARQRTYAERLNTLDKLKNKILTSLEKLEEATSVEAFGRIINGIIQQQPFFANDLIALEEIIENLQGKLDERDPTLQRGAEDDLVALTNVKTLAQELLAKVNAGYSSSQRASRRRS